MVSSEKYQVPAKAKELKVHWKKIKMFCLFTCISEKTMGVEWGEAGDHYSGNQEAVFPMTLP